jgi:RND family efflux transporter MFP subunit
MKTALKALAVVILVAAAFAGGYLVRASRRNPTAPVSRRVLYYVDAMNPAFKSDKPGLAPDGMLLQPVYAESASGTAGSVGDKRGASMPPGTIKIAPERQQLIGVTFATAELSGEPRTIRAVGKVTYDETRVSHVHTRIEGWIEQVFVNFTGAVVTQGVPMLTIYSPEMLASQQELLLAARARDLMRDNPLASAAEHGDSLFAAAKRRLELWQLSDDQIQHVLTTGEPVRTVTLSAPASGFVTERKAFPNQRVTPESDLYTIVDLTHAWIVADVFESDIASIKVGDAASVMFPTGGPSLAAHVNYIQPDVDPMTRTLRVRLDANNPGLRMKPDMFVNVEFGVRSPMQLVVPADAVLDTGTRQTVFVDLGDGYLEPRSVVVGERLGDRVAITRGLSVGERVVSSGTFLIDSESQLKAATQGMGAPTGQHGDAPASHGEPPRSAVPPHAAPTAEGHHHD